MHLIVTAPPSAAYLKDPMNTSSVDDNRESIEPVRRSALTQHAAAAKKTKEMSRRQVMKGGGECVDA